jgi:hypothetical protein
VIPLCFAKLLSHVLHLSHLQDSNKQLEQTTGKLQEEKLRLDALLVRQYNLIAVLGKPNVRRGCRDVDDGGVSPDSSTGDLPEGLTLGECRRLETVGGGNEWCCALISAQVKFEDYVQVPLPAFMTISSLAAARPQVS